MAVRLGDTAPDFEADTTEGPISFHDWLGDSWGVLFSHPKDFTPVCTTELGAVAKLKPEFDKRNVKVIGLSVDPHRPPRGAGPSDIEETQGTALNFPLIGDPDRKVADLYDMIHPNANDTLTVRSVFIIGPDKKVKLTLTYPASTGRNFDEILRVIDSLQLTANYKVATPANWKDGEDVIIVPARSATRRPRSCSPRAGPRSSPTCGCCPSPDADPPIGGAPSTEKRTRRPTSVGHTGRYDNHHRYPPDGRGGRRRREELRQGRERGARPRRRHRAVRNGAFTAIMGPSGSGKSTLMHCLAGLDTPHVGPGVHRRHRPVDRSHEKQLTQLRRDKVGFIFQAFNLIPTLTAHREHHPPARPRRPQARPGVARHRWSTPSGWPTG